MAEARPCGKKGRGLFAARLIRARAWVASFGPTEPVEDQDIEQVQERIGYVLKVQNQGSSWKPIDEDASEAYKAMLANHQCSGPQEANVELVPGDEDEDDNQTFYLRALRDIEPGEEIVYCYSDERCIQNPYLLFAPATSSASAVVKNFLPATGDETLSGEAPQEHSPSESLCVCVFCQFFAAICTRSPETLIPAIEPMSPW